ncbi:MAG: lamin tail domain-containing protein [Bacteroidota bacterium]
MNKTITLGLLWAVCSWSLLPAQTIQPGDLVINELLASNTTNTADQDGEFDDWIELFNPTSQSLNLSQVYLTDDPANPTAYALPDTTIPAGGYLIIWADDDSLQTGLHAFFKLTTAGEFLWIGYANGAVIDSLTFPQQNTDVSWGRLPNGTGNFQYMPPTFSGPNQDFAVVNDTIQPGALVINEFMASNQTTQPDQDGEFDDWIELYNTTNNALSLSRVYLSDEYANPVAWPFPDTVIGPRSYLIIWADDDGNQAGLHASFRLGSGGEQLFLGYADGTSIDSLSFGPQSVDTTWGRFPNGSGPFAFLQPTFAAENNPLPPAGLADGFPDLQVKVFPNPASDRLFLQFSRPIDAQLSLLGLRGKVILQERLQGISERTLDLSLLPPGIYVLRLGERGHQKILVK